MTIKPSVSQATIPPDPNDPQPGLSPTHPALSPLPAGSVDQVGDYKVLGVLGSGGMGIVYKAFDQKLGRIVALKMLQVGVEAGPEEMIRFRGEAEALGSLQHPHIVQVFDFGMHNGSPYLVLEFVNGFGLDRKLQGQPQPPRRAAELVELLARAMHAAHQQGIIHRDLKPANVMLTADGVPKITDFGLAKRLQAGAGLTQTGALMGTPSYMAPEQAAGKKDVGCGADVYSLGAVLYEMLTGRPPFRGATLQETMEQVQMADPAPPSRLVPKVPRDLQTVCLKCLHKAPGRRYLTAKDLADDLRNWLDGLPVTARPAHSLEKFVRTVARRPLRAAVVVAGLLVVVLAIALALAWRDKGLQEEATRLELAYQQQVIEQKEVTEMAEREKEEARRSLDYLREMLSLTMGRDLRNGTGLQRLEQNLRDHENQNTGGLSADKAMVLAGAYFQLANLRQDQGELDRALSTLDKAAELALAAAGEDRIKFEAQLLLARVHQKRGLLRSQTSPEQAVKDSGEALKLLDEVRKVDSGKPEFARLQADALHDLAVATSRLPADREDRHKNMLKAEENYRKAENGLRALVRMPDASNDDWRNLARTLAALGNLYLDLGKRSEADAVYWESHQIRERLVDGAKPGDYEPKYQLARSWANFGRYQTRERILGTALYFSRQSEKLRRELNRKQPDNKDYVLELTGVLNRIAELELFTADQEPDVNKKLAPTEGLKETENLLRECSLLLTGLLDTLKADLENYDRETGTRAYSLLGECNALQARAAMLRITLAPDKRALEEAAIEDARSAARAAGDIFAKVGDRRKLTEDELYQQAAARFLSLEIYGQTRARSDEDVTNYYKPGITILTEALRLGFRRLAPEEIARDRAFRSVADKDWFKTLLKTGAPPDPPKAEPAAKQP